MQDTHDFVLTRVYIGHKTIRLARVISNAAGALLLCCPFVILLLAIGRLVVVTCAVLVRVLFCVMDGAGRRLHPHWEPQS
jgi:hypothetical protein